MLQFITPRGNEQRRLAEPVPTISSGVHASATRGRPSPSSIPTSMPRLYTFERLFGSIDGLARVLARARLDPGLPVGILVSSQESQVLHCLAAMALGLTPAILTPPHRKLNRAYYLETTRKIFDYANFSAVITDVDDLAPAATSLHAFTLERRSTASGSGRQQHASVEGSAFLQFLVRYHRYQARRDRQPRSGTRPDRGLCRGHRFSRPATAS